MGVENMGEEGVGKVPSPHHSGGEWVNTWGCMRGAQAKCLSNICTVGCRMKNIILMLVDSLN